MSFNLANNVSNPGQDSPLDSGRSKGEYSLDTFVKPEGDLHSGLASEFHSRPRISPEDSSTVTKTTQDTRLRKVMEEGSPEALEAEIKRSSVLLEDIKLHLQSSVNNDSAHWLHQIGKDFLTITK